MITHAGLLQAILAAPDDDTPRVVYADWLDDHGEVTLAAAIRDSGRRVVKKKFGVDFDSPGGALTLGESDIGSHADGWTIVGEVHEDYFLWVNDFIATHASLGMVWGNFEQEVVATSEEAFADFYVNHKPGAWDYWDI